MGSGGILILRLVTARDLYLFTTLGLLTRARQQNPYTRFWKPTNYNLPPSSPHLDLDPYIFILLNSR